MATTAQSEARQKVSEMFNATLREQERLRAVLSPEELEQDRQRKIEKFNRTCEELTREAQANGLTEEILAQILAEE
jgi:hypothetical protein